MDIEKACHEIALTAARMYVDSNTPAYKCADGFEKLVTDLVRQYKKAYKMADEQVRK